MRGGKTRRAISAVAISAFARDTPYQKVPPEASST
jgi:hypothetical protein